MNKRELLEFLKEIGVIKVIPEKEKEPAPQEAETSSKSNTSINNDNTQNEGCQEEIDYKSKYIKCSNLLCLTELRIKKIYQLLNNVWEDFASVGKASSYGIMSVDTQVDELWGSSKDDKWKAEEVQRIKSEKGLVPGNDTSVGDELEI